jgi:hypothetical protein
VPSFISQVLLAARIAEMHREAQITRRGRGLKRAPRRAQQAWAPARPAEPPARRSANAQRTRSRPAACPPNRAAHAAVQMGEHDRRNKP